MKRSTSWCCLWSACWTIQGTWSSEQHRKTSLRNSTWKTSCPSSNCKKDLSLLCFLSLQLSPSIHKSSLIVLSAVVRSINSKFFLRIPHRKRIAFAISFMILGFTIIALSSLTSNKIGFYTSLLGSMICGAMCAFGESIILGKQQHHLQISSSNCWTPSGYLKVFPSKLVGGWSSGTGCAGPFGSGLVLVFKAIGFDLYIVRKNASLFLYLKSKPVL